MAMRAKAKKGSGKPASAAKAKASAERGRSSGARSGRGGGGKDVEPLATEAGLGKNARKAGRTAAVLRKPAAAEHGDVGSVEAMMSRVPAAVPLGNGGAEHPEWIRICREYNRVKFLDIAPGISWSSAGPRGRG